MQALTDGAEAEGHPGTGVFKDSGPEGSDMQASRQEGT